MASSFTFVSLEGARYYRDFVARAHPIALAGFAQAVESSGAPIGSLDGSVHSLLDAWRWWRDFIDEGMPGVPAFLHPESEALGHLDVRDNSEVSSDPRYSFEREVTASRLLDAYLFEVLRSIEPRATWEVQPIRGNWDDRTTRIVLKPRARPTQLHRTALLATQTWVMRREGTEADDYLQQMFLNDIYLGKRRETRRALTVPSTRNPLASVDGAGFSWTDSDLLTPDLSRFMEHPPLEPMAILQLAVPTTDEMGQPGLVPMDPEPFAEAFRRRRLVDVETGRLFAAFPADGFVYLHDVESNGEITVNITDTRMLGAYVKSGLGDAAQWKEFSAWASEVALPQGALLAPRDDPRWGDA